MRWDGGKIIKFEGVGLKKCKRCHSIGGRPCGKLNSVGDRGLKKLNSVGGGGKKIPILEEVEVKKISVPTPPPGIKWNSPNNSCLKEYENNIKSSEFQ